MLCFLGTQLQRVLTTPSHLKTADFTALTMLDDRSKKILEALVEEHIAIAEPVGSRAIAKRSQIGLSPASVRNVMSDLEEGGYIESPHTSAGRVPTEKGYRFYVESLLQVRPLTNIEETQLQTFCDIKGLQINDALRNIGKTLSSFSNYTGIVMAPKFESTIFKQIDFVRLSDRQILVIIVSQSGIVQNKLIEMEDGIGDDELHQSANYLNAEFSGLSMSEARKRLSTELNEDQPLYDSIMSRALKLSDEVFSVSGDGEVIIEGKTNILDQPEFHDTDRVKKIMNTFEQKSTLLDLLDKSQEADGIKIFIGNEVGNSDLEGCSMVTSNFTLREGVVGSLGVIGPSRMSYSQVIPIVDYTAQILSRVMLENN